MVARKILIIGGGFGGLGCLRRLKSRPHGLSVILIDRKTSSDFLPLLPDRIGRGFPPASMTDDIPALARRCGADFIQGEARAVDIEGKFVSVGKTEHRFDGLVIASGMEANFYGNDELAKKALTLTSVRDALRLKTALETDAYSNVFVVGGRIHRDRNCEPHPPVVPADRPPHGHHGP